MLEIGLLGAGRIGDAHAKTISAHASSHLSAVSDAVPHNAEALAARHGADVRTSEDVIGDPAIEADLIATSADAHSDLIEAGARAGKAILCEKPVDLDLQRAIACRDAVAKTGAPELLSVASFDPAPPPVSYVRVAGGSGGT